MIKAADKQKGTFNDDQIHPIRHSYDLIPLKTSIKNLKDRVWNLQTDSFQFLEKNEIEQIPV